jgi:hypothetical protein
LSIARPAVAENWSGEDIRLSEVEARLAELRVAGVREGQAPNLRTSVMTHIAWVPERWLEPARATLAGMGEAHPSRTILLRPEPLSPLDRLDATVAVECYDIPGIERNVCSEIVELRLHGRRASAPASVVIPLLIPDLPVFCRWRGDLPFGAAELEGLLDVIDRLIVDSSEWEDPAGSYERLAGLFARCAVSDIAWARTTTWRAALAERWPGIASVQTLQVAGPQADALLLVGWLRARLGRSEIELAHEDAPAIELVEADGELVERPPGELPSASEVLSAELDRLTRDRVYESAVLAAAA